MKEMNIKVEKEIKKVKKSLAREIVEWFFCILAAFVLAVTIKYLLFTPTLVQQTSMTPTILDGERVLINRTVRTLKLPIFRGDIITFEKPAGTENGLGFYNDQDTVKYFLAHDVLEIG